MTKATVGRIAAAAALLCSGMLCYPASAVEVEQEFELYFQQAYQGPASTPRQAKADEYQPVAHGVVLDHYKLELSSGSYELNFDANRVNQLDQSFKLCGGEPGVFSYAASWDQDPHIKSYNARTLYTRTADSLILQPATIRGTGSAGSAWYNTYLGDLGNAPYTTLQIQSNKGAADFTMHPSKDWTISTGASRLQKTGTRDLGVGFGFGTSANGNVHLPQPVDSTADEAYLDIGFAKKAYQFDLRYDVSAYNNTFTSLTWDSPFNATLSAKPTQGREALEPDNIAHTFTLSGGAELPAQTHFSGQLGVSFWRQNEGLVPYTINAGPVASAPAGFDPRALSNLPMQSANRAMDIYTQLYRLSNSALKDFRTSLTFRSYVLANKSATYTEPGYVQYDTTWSNGPYTPARPAYIKDSLEWKGDYELTKSLSVDGGYTYDYTNSSDREVRKSYEQTFVLGTTFRPTPNFFVNVSGQRAERRAKEFDFEDYQTSASTFTENPGLVRFDVGDRNRNEGRVQVQYNHGESNYSLSYHLTQDHYLPGMQPMAGEDYAGYEWRTALPVLDPHSGNQYGLLTNDSHAVGLNVTQALPKDFSADFYYEYDYSKMIIRGNANGKFQLAASDWIERVTEFSNIAGAALNYQPASRFSANVGYDLSSTVGRSDPIGENGPVNNTILGNNIGRNGVAGSTLESLPVTRRITHTINVKSRYQWTKNLGITARYRYQQYNIADYLVDNIPLVSSTGNIFMGASQQSFFIHAMSLGVDYRF